MQQNGPQVRPEAGTEGKAGKRVQRCRVGNGVRGIKTDLVFFGRVLCGALVRPPKR